MSSGFRDLWVWKATLKSTLKQREVLRYHVQSSAPMDFISACAAINDINSVTDKRYRGTHMPESIGCSPAMSTSSSAGNDIGSETSASRWPSYTLVILCCWHISAPYRTPGLCHLSMALTRQQSTWCYSVQLTTKTGGTSGKEDSSTQNLDASGTC